MEYLNAIEAARDKYLAYNAIKFQRFQELLSDRSRRIVNAIPYLLSVNLKKLPGYVEGIKAYGIRNYAPDEDCRRFINTKFPGTGSWQRHERPAIEMLAVMGSVGTIAYNKKSDFDYWVSIDKQTIDPSDYARFREKIQAIQRWAMQELQVPVHLFINDTTDLKKNIFAEDDDEAFGSTVGAVLKDEFFRSSILVAGKIPFWWVIPTFVSDSEYQRVYDSLPEENRQNDFIDVGNLSRISKREFLGAALFQIIKSLNNPFKSIIKIGVLERYLFGDEDSSILCQKVKINILRGNFDNTIIDSYLLMFKEVYDFYESRKQDPDLLEVLKQNLYLKIDPQLSKFTKYFNAGDNARVPLKVQVMLKLITEWGWKLDTIRDLDNFDNWDFNRVMAFWDMVKRFLLLSYQRISKHLPQLNLKTEISESDLLLLSRKLKTHFRKEKDKIEQLITFKDTSYEPVLYIDPVNEGIQAVEWRLYKRNRSDGDTFTTATIRTDTDLVRLLVWCTLNNIYDPALTRINIQSGYVRINPNQVIDLMNTIALFFSPERIATQNEYYLRQMFKLASIVIINFNIENSDTIKTVHHLYYTSWDESYLSERRPDELSALLDDILRDAVPLGRKFDQYCKIIVPEPYRKSYKAITAVFQQAYAFLVESASGETPRRFVYYLNGKYVTSTREGGTISTSAYGSLAELFMAKALKPKKRIAYGFCEDESFSALAAICSAAREDSFTIGYEERRNGITVYVINETGNIFVFIRDLTHKDRYLLYLYDFCRSVIARINATEQPSGLHPDAIRIYAIQSDRQNRVAHEEITDHIKNRYFSKSKLSRALTADIAKYMSAETFYNVLFPDEVSSGFMSIGEMYSVAERIKQLRQRAVDLYPVVQDISFNDLRREDLVLGSTLYFMEKYKMELMIERAMAKNR